MVLANIRVGLPFITCPRRTELAEKLHALVTAVTSLPREERPQLYLVVMTQKLNAPTLPPPYITSFDGVIVVGEDIGKVAATFEIPLIHIIADNQLFEEIDCFFSVDSDMPFIHPSDRWISLQNSEWQHLHNATPYLQDEWYEGNPLAVQHSYGLPDAFVLCPDHCWPEFDHSLLCRTIALLRLQGQDVHLVCTGTTQVPNNSSYFFELQNYCQDIGIADLIHFIGPLPHYDTLQLLRRCLFVAASDHGQAKDRIIQDCRAFAKPLLLVTDNLKTNFASGITTDCQPAYKELARYFSILLSVSHIGPDREKETAAKQSCGNLTYYAAQQFCELARKAVPAQDPDMSLHSQLSNSKDSRILSLFSFFRNILTPLFITPKNQTVDQVSSFDSVEPNNAIVIATSLAPGNIINQRTATDSWLNLGFNVVSINTPEEINILKTDYPNIEFIAATRDARAQYGKSYIYFDDFLSFFAKQKYSVCGIVNSDIHLQNKDLHAFICKEAVNSLVYGPRVNIDSLASLEGTMDLYGFDYFFFDKQLISCFPREEFCLGLPAWDYWVPLIAALHHIALKKLITPVAYHVKHDLNYDFNTLLSLSFTLARYFPLPFELSSTTAFQFGEHWQGTLNKYTVNVEIG